MNEPVDWTLATWEGSRRRQHQEFLALSFREKMEAIEEMGVVPERLTRERRRRGERVVGPHGKDLPFPEGG